MVSNQSKGIKRILSFAGRYRGLLTFARCLSGISALFIIGPFICVYFAARELIAVFLGDQLNGQALLNWGLFALGLELVGVVLYFLALLSSHIVAFHIQKNLQMAALRHLAHMPIGYFNANPSGKLRKIIDENSFQTETFIAHQLKNYAIVFQNVTLFDESVMENIRLGRSGASDEDVRAAAKAAQCDEFIDRLPQGYDTNIGENGSKLSGGERQRISIARALLKNAPVILLDEATASMDAESETMVQTALSALLKGRTVIVIAHRMRTIANADKIVVLDKGKVTEVGTPSELAKKGGVYAHLVALQQKQQMSSLPT